MQRHRNAILKTARAVAFVVVAGALHATGASAQETGANGSRPAKPAVWVELRPATLPASPPLVAPNYAAPARPLPSVERVGVDAGESQPLTLEEAIQLALENNNDIDASRIDVEMAEHDLSAARGAYDLRFSAESYFERSTTPVASFLGGSRDGKLRATDVTGKVGFEGLSPWAGGSFRFEFSSTRLSTDNFFNDINPTVSTGFKLSYTQPLLRGRKTDDTRRRIEIASKNLGLTDAQFRRRATEVITWDPLESTCRHASLSIL